MKDAVSSHAAGGHITYTCIGQDSFLIEMTIYRDCSGISMPQTTTVQISSVSDPGCTGGSLSLQRIPNTGQDITPLCPGFFSPCNGGSVPSLGIEEYVYQGIFVAPQGGCEYNISYTLCCRNFVISNIVSPGSQRLYLNATLQSGHTPCNSSPQTMNHLLSYICINVPFAYNYGAYDPDGDSLHFSLVPCRTVGGDIIDWQAPYTLENPLPTVNGISLNSQTGAIAFTPTALMVGVMCIKIEEFRDGIKIGKVYRDLQFVIEDCKNPAPVAQSFDGLFVGGSYNTTACPGQELNFSIGSWDTNHFQSVTMSWTSGIPGATFDIVPAQYPTGYFSWTVPDSAKGLYVFTVQVRDDGCPLVATGVYTYTIRVADADINTGGHKYLCEGNSLQVFPEMSGNLEDFSWEVISGDPNSITHPDQLNAILHPNQTTTYVVHGSNSFCSASDTLVVEVILLQDIAIDPVSARYEDSPPDTLKVAKAGGIWSGNGITDSLLGIFDAGVAGSGNHVITYLLEGSGCKDSITILVNAGSDPLSITEVENLRSFHLYPNPSTNIVHLEVELSGESKILVEVYDFNGRKVYAGEEFNSSGFEYRLNLKEQSNGNYLVRIKIDDQVVSKVVKLMSGK